jgi:hypothetical protein
VPPMSLGAAVLLNFINHIDYNLYASVNSNTTKNTFIIKLSLLVGEELIKHDNQSMNVFSFYSLPCYIPHWPEMQLLQKLITPHLYCTVGNYFSFHCIRYSQYQKNISKVVTLSGCLSYGMHICMMTCSVKI